MMNKKKIESMFQRLDKKEVHIAVGDFAVVMENLDDCHKAGKLMNGYKSIQVVYDIHGLFAGYAQ